jgi:predicted Zn-dependent protease
MKSIVLLAALFTILIVSCSYSPTAVQIEIDSQFPSANREIILEALQDWSSKTNRGFQVSTISYPDGISTKSEYNVIKFIVSDVQENHIAGTTLDVIGLTTTEYSNTGHLTDHIQAIVYLWPEQTNSTFGAISRHEIGHAFNLGHYCSEEQAQESWTQCQVVSTDPEPSIMYPALSSTQTVQPIDVYRFCQLWDCPE